MYFAVTVFTDDDDNKELEKFRTVSILSKSFFEIELITFPFTYCKVREAKMCRRLTAVRSVMTSTSLHPESFL